MLGTSGDEPACQAVRSVRTVSLPTENYDYELPSKLIAQTPLKERAASRLLVATEGKIKDKHICDLPRLLDDGDLLVLNNTRVQKARLHLKKETGGSVEILALFSGSDKNSEKGWTALTGSNRKISDGTLLFHNGEPVLEVGPRISPDPPGERLISPAGKYTDISQLLEDLGELPLPPYINVWLENPERYQTVYSQKTARSAAAPTAGLHLTENLICELKNAGIQVAEIELRVGLATFTPIKTRYVNEHKIHSEHYFVPAEILELCQKTKAAGKKVVAVGTTVVRALESAALSGQLSGSTELFIQPGFDFQIVDRLITNFHLPRSSLLVLLSAFIGGKQEKGWKEIYSHAVVQKYRFLSFGDAMLVDQGTP